ncbi:hypothetical protein [Virgisporangium aurantiacum]|uniref:hypothetical protein n=1 Tax=Virgisporangium aurantiacum TaxID=175570 RepID=UPI001EF1D25E|nr:hypothetical protein [Virgisporangium aurantiacum]
MRSATRHRLGHPAVPAGVLLTAGGCLLLAVSAAPPARPVVPALAWTLLGVCAGYSISGSV